MADYVQIARERGLREIGFADHLPLYFHPPGRRPPDLAMADVELPEYVADVLALRKANPDLPIRLGIEADFIPGKEKQLAALLERYPFDYVLGSVHYIDGWGFDHPDFRDGYRDWEADALYRRYFELLQAAARSGLFDSLAHPDLLKKFDYRPVGDITSLYRETVAVIAEAGVCIEVNTAGLRVPAGEIYPHPTFLRFCREFHVPATLGSDAHTPEQVGSGFPEAIALLEQAGYREIATFQGRRRSLISILNLEL
jgi:histidinol-phosphatase (PHP family)